MATPPDNAAFRPSHLRAALTIGLVGGMVLLLSGCARAGGEPYQPALNTPILLTAQEALGQTINPAGSFVAGVDLVVATYATSPDPAGELIVDLRDPADGGLLGTAVRSGAEIADLTWVAMTFDQPVAVGDVVLMEARWTGETPLALWGDVPPSRRAALGGLVNDPYLGGQIVRAGRPSPGDLAFRVRGTGGAAAGMRQVSEVAASTVNRLLAQPLFTSVWVLLLLLSGALALRGLRSTQGGRRLS